MEVKEKLKQEEVVPVGLKLLVFSLFVVQGVILVFSTVGLFL